MYCVSSADCSSACSDYDELSSESSDSKITSDEDLHDLYQSFDFEDSASQTSAQTPSCKQPGANTETGAHSSSRAICWYFSTRYITGLQLKPSLNCRNCSQCTYPQKLPHFFVDAYPQSQPVQHFYCSCCQRSVCTGNGCTGGRTSVFITVPSGPQLKRMMESIKLHVYTYIILV